MDPRTAVSAYKTDVVETAPPIKIIRMLYQTCLRHIDAAARCDAGDPTSEFVDLVSKADAIVAELRIALEKEVAPELSENLEQLYLFVESTLHTAMNDRSTSGLVGARNVMATLFEAWTQVEAESPTTSQTTDAA